MLINIFCFVGEKSAIQNSQDIKCFFWLIYKKSAVLSVATVKTWSMELFESKYIILS